MGEFTKGKWELKVKFNGRPEGGQLAIGVGEEILAELRMSENDLANAHLIVASPDLLEQVIEDGLTICRLCRRLNPQHTECDSCEDLEDRKKLIARANGEG